jgi:hypothetical protein
MGMACTRRESDKPPILYHGSPVHLERLEPRPARGVRTAHDRLTAVYATDLRSLAIAFALMPPSGAGALSCEVHLASDPQEPPRIVYHAGRPTSGGVGWLYLLPSDTFEPLPEHQWVSYSPIVPLACEQIQVEAYLHWIEYAGEQGEPTRGQ